jgi:deoxyribonuclease IV
MKIGLKLWSINENFIPHALAAYENGLCDYLELFYFPGSMDILPQWVNLKNIPFIIHAPHTRSGLNPAEASMYAGNMKLAAESFRFADELHAQYVIFHPGMAGTLTESARQIKCFGDAARILIENKPFHSITEPFIPCRGSDFFEIDYLLTYTGADFCLDLGHAICAANSLKQNALVFISELVRLCPRVFHLSDGDFNSPIDSHLNLGHGSYPLAALVKHIPADAVVTLETNKNYADHLSDYMDDVHHIRSLLSQVHV